MCSHSARASAGRRSRRRARAGPDCAEAFCPSSAAMISSASAGLLQVVVRAEVHRVDRGGDAAVAGQHDDARLGASSSCRSLTSSSPDGPGIFEIDHGELGGMRARAASIAVAWLAAVRTS